MPQIINTQTAPVAVGRGASTGDGPLFLRRARDFYVQTGSSSQSIRAVYIIQSFYFIFKKGPISRRDQLATSHHAVSKSRHNHPGLAFGPTEEKYV